MRADGEGSVNGTVCPRRDAVAVVVVGHDGTGDGDGVPLAVRDW